MGKDNDGGAHQFEVARFAETLDGWLAGHDDLLRGLAALRELGDDGFSAVTAVLVVPEVRKLRLGWELWEAMAEGEGKDPEVLLLDAIPLSRIELGRAALWGETALGETSWGAA
jgi:hypothetical protein